jgi:hypothetical protein
MRGALVVTCGAIAGCSSATGDGDTNLGDSRQAVTAVVSNFLGCTAQTMEGDYIAWWGYENTSGVQQTVPAGSDNFFTPPLSHPDDAADPLTVFSPGKFRFAFSTRYAGPSQAWTLLGNTWTSTPITRPCAPTPTPVTIPLGTTITIGSNASDAVAQSAQRLADKLLQMTGVTFPIDRAVRPGLLSVGKDGDFTDFRWPYRAGIFAPQSPLGQEDYVVWTAGGSAPVVAIAGATETAVDRAVWEFLYQLGYRHFFPTPDWEIVPHLTALNLPALSIQRRPAFILRQPATFFSGFPDADLQETVDWLETWRTHNQLQTKAETDETHLSTSDSREDSIASEWSTKICPAAPGSGSCDISGLMSSSKKSLCLRNVAVPTKVGPVDAARVVREYTNWFFDQNPKALTVPASPQDGVTSIQGCSSTDEPTGSLRLIELSGWAAEEAARRNKLASVKTGTENSRAPADLHGLTIARNLIIGVDQSAAGANVISEWKHMGANLVGLHRSGMSSVQGLLGYSPSELQLEHPQLVADIFSDLHRRGATWFYSKDDWGGWGPYGLGYYVMARALLTGDADVPAIRADFLARAFGSASTQMANFYDIMDQSRASDDLLARLYQAIASARAANSDPAVAKRIDALALYVRYLELYRERDCAANWDCPTATAHLKKTLQFVYATRKTMMTNAAYIFRRLDADLNRYSSCAPAACSTSCGSDSSSDAHFVQPTCAEFNSPVSCNTWKAPPDPTELDVSAIVAHGVASHQVFPYIADDSELKTNLVPATPPSGTYSNLLVGGVLEIFPSRWYTVPDATGHVGFSIVAPPVDLYATLSPLGSPTAEQVQWVHGSTAQTVNFLASTSGVQKISFEHFIDYLLDYTPGTRMVTLAGSGEDTFSAKGQPPLWFYVPRDKTRVGVWVGLDKETAAPIEKVQMRRFHGPKTAEMGPWVEDARVSSPKLYCPDNVEFDAVQLPANNYALWALAGNSDGITARTPIVLRNVPQSLARRPSEFLLPSAVVQRDQLAP